MPLDPLFYKNAPKAAAPPAPLGAFFLTQGGALAHPRNLFIARSSARFVKESRRKIALVGVTPPAPLRGYYALALPRRDPRVFVAVRRSSAGGSPVARSLLITS